MTIAGLIMIVTAVFLADDIQQNRFESARNGYEYMESGKYHEATQEFEIYLNVDSKVYWKLIDMTNEYQYTREGVMEAVRQCAQLCSK